MLSGNKRFLKMSGMAFALILSTSILETQAQTVTPWLTKGDKSQLLQQQVDVDFVANSGTNSYTITIDPLVTFQTIDGFGFCMTEGSAEVISGLAATQQDALLNELFNKSTGIGVSVIRISIGASDLSSSDYSYNEVAGDVNMTNFSLAGPDLTYLIPILKKALAINPNIKILATPWTPPRWMKTNNSWIGGSLNTSYYAAYANYFVRYFQAMSAQGINIWAITPQNEPENPNNDPSMSMTSTEEKNFINNNLGPAMASAGYSNIKIIAFDHNCDNTSYPTDVCNNSTYVDGSAFHLYAGSITALTTVKNNTNKNIYFTEQFTSSTGSFSGDFGWHMQNVVTGAVNNWAKTVLEWNVANNSNIGPNTPGGCTTCLGAYTINTSTSYTRNVSYYIIGQVSKFTSAGAVRILSSSSNSAIATSAFKNPNGSLVVLAYNSSATAKDVKILNGTRSFTYSIPKASAVTFTWNNATPVPVTGVSVTPTTVAVPVNGTTQLTATVTPSNATNQVVTWSSGNSDVATVSANGLVTGISAGNAIVTVTTQDGNFTSTSSITVNVVSVTGVSVSPITAAININGSQQLTATISPGNASNKNVVWSSGNASVATVSATGLVTGVAAGNTTITVTTQDGNYTATCAITVNAGSIVYPGYYNIINKNSLKGLDVVNNSTSSGANIQQWDITNGGGNNQRWRLDDAGNGRYYIKVKSTQMCLSLTRNSTANGIQIVQKTCNNATSQQWIVTELGGGYLKIMNVYAGKSLDVSNSSTSNGALIKDNTYSGIASQQWQLVQVESMKSGKVANSLTDVNNSDICLFPRPADNFITIKLSPKAYFRFFEITNISGSVVEKQNIHTDSDKATIYIENLKSGLYFIKLIGNENSVIEKFIKR